MIATVLNHIATMEAMTAMCLIVCIGSLLVAVAEWAQLGVKPSALLRTLIFWSLLSAGISCVLWQFPEVAIVQGPVTASGREVIDAATLLYFIGQCASALVFLILRWREVREGVQNRGLDSP